MEFSVLGSGSSGNCSLVQDGQRGMLIDCGFGPRTLSQRLRQVGSDWDQITDVLLTHTHGDHWKETAIDALVQRRVLLWMHRQHLQRLQKRSRALRTLVKLDLVRLYRPDHWQALEGSWRFLPFDVSHDSGRTFGFRIEGQADLFSAAWALGYVCDLGTWDQAVVDGLRGCETLAIEFNHDEQMQKQSPRSAALIARVLGDRGHLSNAQAAELLDRVLSDSAASDCRPVQIFQLHLSQQCNRTELARVAAAAVIAERGDLASKISLLTARQGSVVSGRRDRPEPPPALSVIPARYQAS